MMAVLQGPGWKQVVAIALALACGACQSFPIADFTRSDADLNFYEDEHLAPHQGGFGTGHFPGGGKLVLSLFDVRDRPNVSHTMNYDNLMIEIDTRKARGTFKFPSAPVRLVASKGWTFTFRGHIAEAATGEIELLGRDGADLIVRLDLLLDYVDPGNHPGEKMEGFVRHLQGRFRFRPGRRESNF